MHNNAFTGSNYCSYQPASRFGQKWQSYCQKKLFFRLKSVRRDLWSSMHIDTLMDSSFGWYLPTFQVSSKLAEKWRSYHRRKLFFRPKLVKRVPMVSHAYRHFNGLYFGLISTHISSFIKIGRKMTKLSSEKAIFWLKSVRRDPWSPMHIAVLMNSSLD